VERTAVPASAPPVGGAAPPSFDTVYRAHARTVARWAARLGGPRADLEDVVQEVFVIVARRLPEFRGEAPIEAWLYRITRKTVANARRRARLRRWLGLPAERLDDHPATAPDPAAALERRQAEVRFYRLLATLPERYREVLVLFELEGLSTQEIAALTGTKLATVRVWLHRGRAAFLAADEKLARKEASP
jgi:RNA polymerase sigma-70 factor (ECF subfamily)